MPPIDHVPWLLGQWDMPLAKWLVHITCDPGVRGPKLTRALCTLTHTQYSAYGKRFMTKPHCARQLLNYFVITYVSCSEPKDWKMDCENITLLAVKDKIGTSNIGGSVYYRLQSNRESDISSFLSMTPICVDVKMCSDQFEAVDVDSVERRKKTKQ